MKLLDLFSGAGGFALGLQNSGIHISKHYFSEVDAHAIANYKYNFKNAEYVGSITDVRGFRGQADIITFGSPCQDFSLAGKRAGMDGERSSLISEAIRLVDEIRPSIFIWENVKGTFSSNARADFWAIIQAFTNIGGYRLEWQLLNTKWFLPQNRERIYLVGHLAEAGGSFKQVFPIEENDRLFDGKKTSRERRSQTKYSSTTLRAGNLRATDTYINTPSYAGTLTAGGNSGGLHSDMTILECVDMKSFKSTTRRGMFKNEEAHTLDCQANLVVGAIRGRNPENPMARVPGQSHIQMLEINKNGISNTLSTVQKDNVVISSFTRDAKGKVINRNDRNICNTITSSTGGNGSTDVFVNNLRRLTEIECERLQGFPDDWTKFGIYDGIIKRVPKTQRYKLTGNAVSVVVVEEIAKRLVVFPKANDKKLTN